MLNEDGNGGFGIMIRIGESKEIAEFILSEATVVLDDPSHYLFSHWLSITVRAAFVFVPAFLWNCLKEFFEPMFDHYFFVVQPNPEVCLDQFDFLTVHW